MHTGEAERLVYGYDNSRRQALPDAVVFPRTHEQVVALVRACREHRVPLTARGRGTNTTGASVPVAGGVVASFERMNRIVRIDPDNRLAVVEPGVLNGDLQAALAPHGFFWPPDPTSAPLLHRRRQPGLQRRRTAHGEIRQHRARTPWACAPWPAPARPSAAASTPPRARPATTSPGC